jgi:hypothetical protein
VGKWVRDVLMGRIVRYHRVDNAELPDASGYHDPVTTRFIEATRLTRRKRDLPDDCFERKAVGDSPPVSGVVTKVVEDLAADEEKAPRSTSARRRASGSSRPW